uniref:Coiled-coil domain-containing protein n=1 Tax=Strigamia maritima TaxID=126957 RepID=T1JL04_STRMM
MQCEVRSMNEERPTRQTEPQPRPGFVNQVCREWIVHEDSALAQKLQDEEIELHYGKNRTERRVVQGDLRHARDVQHEEISEAQKINDMYEQMLLEQEMADAQVALELQHLEDRKEGRGRSYEEADKRLARQLQEKEKLRYERKKKAVEKERRPVERSSAGSSENIIEFDSESPDIITHKLSVREPLLVQESELSEYLLQQASDLDANEIRLLREEQDAEFARKLQEQESMQRKSAADRDRLLAIEAQDRELAKMLQEQERAKLRRAKERARLKALQKQMEQEHATADAEGAQGLLQRPTDIPGLIGKNREKEKEAYGSVHKRRVPAPSLPSDEIEREPVEEQSSSQTPEHVNIAMAIDPTYNRKLSKNANFTSANSGHSGDGNYSSGSTPVLPTPEYRPGMYDDDDEHCYDSDEGPAPPYMPIQGQKRHTLEKKKKERKVAGNNDVEICSLFKKRID